ncbi:MAG: helix-turn-helix transcriptional regulator [Silicimonas sp.]|nr:helix-turn-helix transcriptional regulator [Silicimonas sp.]
MKISVHLVVYVFGVATALTAVLTVIDSLLTAEPITRGDVATDFVELLVLSVAMVASAVVVDRVRGLEQTTSQMRADLEEAAHAGRAWRQQSEQIFQGLSAAVAAQFDEWELTDAEAEVAALILKGVALKEIAGLRHTSEATIRQQAQAIYRKSGLGNRSELAAYFLEDLFDVAGAQLSTTRLSEPTH